MLYIFLVAALILFTMTLGMIRNRRPWLRVAAFALLTAAAIGASLPFDVLVTMIVVTVVVTVIVSLLAYYWRTAMPAERDKVDATIFGGTIPEDWQH